MRHDEEVPRKPDTRTGDRHKGRITLHLNEKLYGRLARFVDATGRPRHGVIVDALEAYLPEEPGEKSSPGAE
jgi:hypothetical protein